MSVNANAVMVFTSYAVEDTGIRFHFVCPDPGPGLESDYYVFATDAELAALTTAIQLRNLMLAKLNRAIRRNGFASKLDPLIGQSVTVP